MGAPRNDDRRDVGYWIAVLLRQLGGVLQFLRRDITSITASSSTTVRYSPR
jgi:hypothetical protein